MKFYIANEGKAWFSWFVIVVCFFYSLGSPQASAMMTVMAGIILAVASFVLFHYYWYQGI